MEKVVYWLAEDGEQFGTEEECINYEMKLMDVSGVRTFDDKYQELSVEKNGFEDFFGKADFMYIIDKEKALKVFKTAESLFGVNVPGDDISFESGDILAYDETTSLFESSWVNISSRANFYNKIWQSVMNVL